MVGDKALRQTTRGLSSDSPYGRIVTNTREKLLGLDCKLTMMPTPVG